MTYRKEVKAVMLKKVLANPGGSVLDIAIEARIPPSTLRTRDVDFLVSRKEQMKEQVDLQRH